jgi:ribosomal-protein-alanine N-acetyltransferase
MAIEPLHLSPTISVTPMRRRHLRSVLRIEAETNPRPWTYSLFLSELRYGESRIYVVARKQHEVVGFAGLMLVVGDGHITNVGIDPEHRREGTATRLLAVLARRAIAEGVGALTLEVRESNTGAQELYRRFGFAPVGVRKNYYADANEDAVIMWANDIDTPTYRSRLAMLEDELPTATILEGI